MITRRTFVHNATAISAAVALASKGHLAFAQAATYHNPIMGGDHPDGSPIRVGNEFYLTHSSFDYAPGLIIWHSRDLINWTPIASALHKYVGTVWAPYLCEYQGHFYIYFPAAGRIHVTHAAAITGPWSEPIDLGIRAIDPAHIAENGRRFLYLAGGQMAELNADGLSVKTPPRVVFEAWPLPAAMRAECTCLEGPKVIRHGDYYYMNVAEGGTAGPATSHAVVSARSRNAEGPWEYSPYNPIAHTTSRNDRWLSIGHGRLVDTPDGQWYMTVHAYESGYRALGRQLLLLPIEWTSDGWFRVPAGITADSAIPVPVSGSHQQPFTDPSDDFTSAELGLQWGFWHEFDPSRFATGKGALVLNAQGKAITDTSPMTTAVGGHSYTVEVDVETELGCEAGIALFYNSEHSTAIRINGDGISPRLPSGSTHSHQEKGAMRARLRIVNDDQEVDFYYQVQGKPWQRTQDSAEISGMHHNVLGGFLDVRPALYACGAGKATFRNFRYWPEAKVPA